MKNDPTSSADSNDSSANSWRILNAKAAMLLDIAAYSKSRGEHDAMMWAIAWLTDLVQKPLEDHLIGKGLAHWEDAVNETFIKVCENLHQYDINREPIPWLFAIARNCARDEQRREDRHLGRKRKVKRKKSPDGPDEGETEDSPLSRIELNDRGMWALVEYLAAHLESQEPGPGELVEANELRDVLERIVSELPEQKRDLLWRVLSGDSYRDIGGDLGISEQAVANRVSRIRDRLRKRLAEEYGGDLSEYSQPRKRRGASEASARAPELPEQGAFEPCACGNEEGACRCGGREPENQHSASQSGQDAERKSEENAKADSDAV